MKYNENKLRAKDLIVVGVFTCLILVLAFVVAMVMSSVPVLAAMASPVMALLVAPLYLYVVTKVARFGAVSIMGLLVGAFFFLVGHFWLCLLWMPVAGLLADLLSRWKQYESSAVNIAGYAIFSLGVAMCANTPMLFFTKDFEKTRTQMGMSEEYIQTLLSLVHGPFIWLVLGLTIAGAVAGALAGNALLRKHFSRGAA